jgi:hypothetical protein
MFEGEKGEIYHHSGLQVEENSVISEIWLGIRTG